MVYITGDTHGDIDFDKIEKYFKKVYCSEKEYLPKLSKNFIR